MPWLAVFIGMLLNNLMGLNESGFSLDFNWFDFA